MRISLNKEVLFISKLVLELEFQYLWQKYGGNASKTGYTFHHLCPPPYESSKMCKKKETKRLYNT